MNTNPDSHAVTPFRRRIPILPTILWTLTAGFIIWTQTNELVGMGTRVALAAASLFVAIVGSLIWFTFCSRYPRKLRYTVFGICLASTVIACYCLRIEEVSGDLIPRLAFRWAPVRDTTMNPIDASHTTDSSVNLAATTSGDFPQFLGPDRNLKVADPGFEFGWSESPPRSVWSIPIGAGWSAFSAVNGYGITMEQRGPDEITSCYEVATGKLIWANSIPARHATVIGGVGPRSTPTIHQGRVYTLGATGMLRCLRGEDGEELWRRNLLEELGVTDDSVSIAWGRSASPLVVDQAIVVPAGGPAGGVKHSLIAYDLATGQELWRGGNRQIGYASPSLTQLDHERQILIVLQNYASGYHPTNGELLWEFTWPGNSTADANNSQAVPIDERRVFVSKGYGQGAAVFEVNQDEDGTWSAVETWSRSNVMKTKYTNVVVHEGHIYGLDDTFLECIDVESGQKRWKVRYDYGQILLVGNTLLVLDENGMLFAVEARPDKHVQLGKFQAVEGLTWNNLCLYDRFLLVRNGQEANCYELELKTDAP
ncbi:MAG: PQQ-binding-like beta-propeller repeat protein [Planctomycetaceae bacterium]|nr:PQQ-binding-like beta-propeller repeat protein [Planctomycetaceae bacterium]